MIQSSTDIALNEQKLKDAKSLAKEIETLTNVITDIQNETKKVTLIKLEGVSDNSSVRIDDAGYGINSTAKPQVILMLQDKIDQLIEMRDHLLEEVNQATT